MATYGREIKDHRKDVDKACNRQVHPLHRLQGFRVFANIVEENVGTEYWRNHCPDTVESLSDVDTHF